jgi:hypothetical protein
MKCAVTFECMKRYKNQMTTVTLERVSLEVSYYVLLQLYDSALITDGETMLC